MSRGTRRLVALGAPWCDNYPLYEAEKAVMGAARVHLVLETGPDEACNLGAVSHLAEELEAAQPDAPDLGGNPVAELTPLAELPGLRESRADGRELDE